MKKYLTQDNVEGERMINLTKITVNKKVHNYKGII